MPSITTRARVPSVVALLVLVATLGVSVQRRARTVVVASSPAIELGVTVEPVLDRTYRTMADERPFVEVTSEELEAVHREICKLQRAKRMPGSVAC